MQKKKYDILILGAGCSGLYSAYQLLQKNCKVLTLEAQPRIGGRILTHIEEKWDYPVELGAEFLHGTAPVTTSLLQAFQQGFLDIPDRHLILQKNKLTSFDQFFPVLSKIIKSIPAKGKDQSVQEFLTQKKITGIPAQMFRSFVEGFHSAELEKMSAQGLKRTEQADEDELNGSSLFRPQKGYQALINDLHKSCLLMDPDYLRLNSQVKKIRWHKSYVEIFTDQKTYTASQVLITLPLGVLKSKNPDIQIDWDPLPKNFQSVLNSVEMGHVQRMVFQFKTRFWENIDAEDKIVFLHAGDDIYFPTWWSTSPARIPFLIAWQGGPKAIEMSEWSEEQKRERALKSLSRLSKRSPAFLKDQMVQMWTHNWSQDPFFQGAYSYVLKDGSHTANKLGQSIEDTVYFAGEACMNDSHRGTVEGALISSQRAVRKILAALASA